MKKLQETARKHYLRRLDLFEDNHRVLDWESEEAQYKRFDVLLDNCPASGRRILDVGCGLGDLAAYLDARGIVCEYVGVDILPEMIRKARQIQPEKTFLAGDLLKEKLFPEKSFDIVVASGIFNLNFRDNEAFLFRCLKEFTRLSRGCIGFNMLHEESPDPQPDYFYFSPEPVVAFLAELGWKARGIRGYLDNDFTVTASPFES